MKVLLMLAHSIAEYDDLRMFSDMGYDVFSIGAYADPAHPGDDKRPALPSAPYHPELRMLVGDQMAAKASLPNELIDWADVIICHHYLDQWIVPQWQRIRHKRVIWRTCGQSDPRLEALMAPLHADGLAIVRYSPKEREHFQRRGVFAGEDALIRFGKYTDDYGGWGGHDGIVANVTQNMAQRGDHCGLRYWLEATSDLKASPAGPGSQDLPGGVGALSYDGLQQYLRRSRTYLYTGTVPAPYTLGLLEALLTGIPVVTLAGDSWMGPADLWEGEDLTRMGFTFPEHAAKQLNAFLRDRDYAYEIGQLQQLRAQALFGVGEVGRQWRAFLGEP